jgi:hypothetical protein
MLLPHELDRGGLHGEYRTAHFLELHDGLIFARTERPGSTREFEDARGTR